MFRTNLSTRPFYNERAVHVALAAAALVVLVLTLFNVTYIVRLSRENTELTSRTDRDRAESVRLSNEAAAIRRTLDKDELEVVAAAAREANDLIDQRTFSWTAFFNYIEATLPPEVMLVAVTPTVKDQQTHVRMTVLSRRWEDIDEFEEKLEASGAFENVFPAQSDVTEQGLQRAILDTTYVARAADPDAATGATPEGQAEPADPGGATPDRVKPPATPPAAKPGPGKSQSGARP